MNRGVVTALLLYFIGGIHSSSGQMSVPCHPVLLDHSEILQICRDSGSITAQERANAISKRLRSVADDPYAPAIIYKVSEYTVDLTSGGTLVAAVFDGDAKLSGIDKEEAARRWAAAFNKAVWSYRNDHALSNIIRRVAISTGVVSVAVLLLLALARITRRSVTIAESRLQQRIQSVDQRFVALLPNHVAHDVAIRLFALVRWIGSAAVIYVAVQLLLGLFPVTRYLAAELLAAVLVPVRSFGDTLVRESPSIAFAIAVAFCARYVLKLNRYVFRKIAEGAITVQSLRPAWAGTTQRLVSILIVILAVLIAYPYIPGSASPAFKGISLFLGVLVSLGSTGLVSNLVSGVMLTYIDAFEPGDYVCLGEHAGFVMRSTIFTTRLKTRTNSVIIVPNSTILSNPITNFNVSTDPGIAVTTTVGVGYDVPWRQVEALLKLAAVRTDSVRTDPPPFVLQRSLNQFDVTYELNAYLRQGVRMYTAQSELNKQILDAFNEYSVQIMTPAYENDPAEPKFVPRQQWRTRPAAAE
jgi:small-conductance mechanosensitive channel